ncbi:uncharacterized protein [Haliotis cracherodii]|uniref:uncharacterized protein LOC124150872 isoform X1 n=1 Tax=Haliotis rufescens TaxID=6454 RepID=UPI001EB01835|nr:uncharacterized protein LOC124150872 isoform X1 [Haliotis rufescens]XP_046378988.1 uncharacterized protein LOC124150872 isoform X1 [Haliotis rufescens]XP_046378989.1 uncharacterized protein LOC124150872 isoform X1 [Haliotis rufescens]
MDLIDYISQIRSCVVEKFSSSPSRDVRGETTTGCNRRDSENGSASVADRTSRDEARRENEQLSAEVEGAQREYKKLKQVVEHLTRDYEASKDFDPLRRYKKMKGMVKRTVLHLRLDPDQQGSSQGIVGLVQGCKDYTLQLEGVKRRGERTNRMRKEDIMADNEKLQEQKKELKRKCSIIRDLVLKLERNYQHSKRFMVVQRYGMIKDMIKTVIHDKLIQ